MRGSPSRSIVDFCFPDRPHQISVYHPAASGGTVAVLAARQLNCSKHSPTGGTPEAIVQVCARALTLERSPKWRKFRGTAAGVHGVGTPSVAGLRRCSKFVPPPGKSRIGIAQTTMRGNVPLAIDENAVRKDSGRIASDFPGGIRFRCQERRVGQLIFLHHLFDFMSRCSGRMHADNQGILLRQLFEEREFRLAGTAPGGPKMIQIRLPLEIRANSANSAVHR